MGENSLFGLRGSLKQTGSSTKRRVFDWSKNRLIFEAHLGKIYSGVDEVTNAQDAILLPDV